MSINLVSRAAFAFACHATYWNVTQELPIAKTKVAEVVGLSIGGIVRGFLPSLAFELLVSRFAPGTPLLLRALFHCIAPQIGATLMPEKVRIFLFSHSPEDAHINF